MATIGEPWAAWPVSAVVGERYRIAAHLGQGGMGRVHRALDLRDGREIALKQLCAHGTAGWESAAALEKEYLRGLNEAGVRGVVLFTAYETCAKVAIAMRDAQALRHYAQLFLREYGLQASRESSAKYQRLMREAQAAGMQQSSSDDSTGRPRCDAGVAEAMTARSRLLACVGATERGRECLRLLLEMTDAASGYLFVVRPAGLQLLAASDDADVDALADGLSRQLQHDLRGDAETASRSERRALPDAHRFHDTAGRAFEAMSLFALRAGTGVPAGAVALHYETDARAPLQPEVLATVAYSMLEADSTEVDSLDSCG